MKALDRNGRAWCLSCGWSAQERYHLKVVPVCWRNACWQWWVTIHPIAP